jgi:hypothetical protein
LVIVTGIALLLAMRADRAIERELRLAREAETAADVEAAIVAYGRAASWLLPLSAGPEQAQRALRSIAAKAAEEDNAPIELMATRAVYSALQSRRVLAASRDELRPVASRIAQLMVQTAPAVIGDGRSAQQRVAALERGLLVESKPRPLGVLLTVVGFVCWVAAMFLLSSRGLDIDHRPTAAARPLGTAIVFGFGLFVLGLALA